MPLPEHIGRYQVLGRLGKGGMGSVYKVIMPKTGNIAALKILDPFEALLDLLGREKVAELFRAEARTMARLQSPYVVTVWDSDSDSDGTPFFVMEFYCNNLGSIIGEHYQVEKLSRPIPPGKAIHFSSEILKGLAALHTNNIIHRDIKPYNILLTDQGSIKICDFGLSAERGEDEATPKGLRVGSPFYAAPEQERNPDHADERSDLYSVGVLLYRMLTGELPSMKNFSLSMINPLYGREWDLFFAKSINLQRENRFQNAAEMRLALAELQLHWEKAMNRACSTETAHTPPAPERHTLLRTTPLRLSGSTAQQTFEVSTLFQPLRPFANSFELSAQGDTVTDRASSLIWQNAGSAKPLDYAEAREYIARLNREKFAGFTHWRLPTVNELLSLARLPQSPHDLCAPYPFDPERTTFWSCDQRSASTAWYIDTEMAFANWQDMTCAYFVKGVCSLR